MTKPAQGKAHLITLEAMQAAAIAVTDQNKASLHPRQDYGPVFLAIQALPAGSNNHSSARVGKNTELLDE